MIETPAIVQTQRQLAAVIHMRVPREQMKDVMGPSIGELMRTIAAQGIAPAGPLFDHHLKMEPGFRD